MAVFVAFVAISYLVGSIPFGIVVGRGLFGVDPREVGSGNIGAANSLRALGKAGAVLVLLGDIVKGVLCTAVALYALRESYAMVAAVGLATIVGHNWSVFLHFGGGKGVATGLGVLAVLSWQSALVFVATWLIVIALCRYSSLASILANLTMAPALLAFKAPQPFVAYALVALALVIWRHAANIRRLAAGEELRIGLSKERDGVT